MTLGSFVSRLQEFNAHLGEFPYDAPGQETPTLSTDEVMDIMYRSVPTSWKNKINEQGFNYLVSPVKEIPAFI